MYDRRVLGINFSSPPFVISHAGVYVLSRASVASLDYIILANIGVTRDMLTYSSFSLSALFEP